LRGKRERRGSDGGRGKDERTEGKKGYMRVGKGREEVEFEKMGERREG
jgi:hypothetical protein